MPTAGPHDRSMRTLVQIALDDYARSFSDPRGGRFPGAHAATDVGTRLPCGSNNDLRRHGPAGGLP